MKRNWPIQVFEKILLIPMYAILFIAWVYLSIIGLLLLPLRWIMQQSFTGALTEYKFNRIDSFNHLFNL